MGLSDALAPPLLLLFRREILLLQVPGAAALGLMKKKRSIETIR
jgi:hypothetical protein